MSLKDKIQELSHKYHQDIISCRRHIHANPELAFEEVETSKFIQDKLNLWDIQFKAGVAKTGVVGLIEGKNPSSRIIALRADMDALPITEKNDVSYKSKNEGKMHACGHDVHSASLLGAARILSEIRNEFEGTVKLIFQPSEERLPGGASVMIDEGVLKNPKPDSIFGQHVYPSLEAGKVGFKAGLYMASADEIYLTIKGKGGHAAMPNTVIDPVLIASHVIIGLQQVVSRNADPSTPTVLSFGKVMANGATNVIPDEVRIEGTFRTFDEKWRMEAHKLITKIAEEICSGMGGACLVDIQKGYPFLKNDEFVTKNARSLSEEYLGAENVVDLPIRMTAEDFAWYSHHVPACFYRLGTGNESKGITSPVHTSTFDIDEDALITGMGLMAWLAAESGKG